MYIHTYIQYFFSDLFEVKLCYGLILLYDAFPIRDIAIYNHSAVTNFSYLNDSDSMLLSDLQF